MQLTNVSILSFLCVQITDAFSNETLKSYCESGSRYLLINSSYIDIRVMPSSYSRYSGIFVLQWEGQSYLCSYALLFILPGCTVCICVFWSQRASPSSVTCSMPSKNLASCWKFFLILRQFYNNLSVKLLVNISGVLAISCGEYSDTPAGYIASPNYPDNYPNSLICAWTVTSTSEILDLLISDMDIAEGEMGCGNDGLFVSFYI